MRGGVGPSSEGKNIDLSREKRKNLERGGPHDETGGKEKESLKKVLGLTKCDHNRVQGYSR